LLPIDAVKVKPGATMSIAHWGGEGTLKAKVRYIEPSALTKVSALGVEEQRVNIIADFVDKSVPLSDRYRVETQTKVWEGKNVLMAPLSALFRCDLDRNRAASNFWCTFVVGGNKPGSIYHAQKRQVKIVQRSNFEAVIQEGLREGEVVILHPTLSRSRQGVYFDSFSPN
jgi:HlyD family secretion protein